MSLKSWLKLWGKAVVILILLTAVVVLWPIWTDDFLLSGYSGFVFIVRVPAWAIIVGTALSAWLLFLAFVRTRVFLRGLLLVATAVAVMIAATAVVVVRMDGKAYNVFVGLVHTQRFLLLNPDTNRMPESCQRFGPVVRYLVDGRPRYLYVGLWPFALTNADDGERFSPCAGWLTTSPQG